MMARRIKGHGQRAWKNHVAVRDTTATNEMRTRIEREDER
jgi:hypothetical protein